MRTCINPRRHEKSAILISRKNVLGFSAKTIRSPKRPRFETGRRQEMTKVGDIYLCEICGNKVRVLEAGPGVLVCCGKPMKLVKA